MPDYEVVRVLDSKARLGESPVWSVDHQVLLWVDILKQTANRFSIATGENVEWSVPSVPGGIVLGEGNSALIVASDGIYDIALDSGAVSKLADAPFDPSKRRFNDCKADRQGRLWSGASNIDPEDQVENGGVIYRYDGMSLTQGYAPITIPNGLAFSPDGRTMYRAESWMRTIYALDYDPNTGTASNQRVFAQVPDDLGVPDGAAMDTEGGYWVALPLGPRMNSIARFSSDGKLDVLIEVPVLMPTMVAFGGLDMATLYLTSARDEHIFSLYSGGKGANDLDGDIFAIQTSFTGVPETKVRVRKAN